MKVAHCLIPAQTEILGEKKNRAFSHLNIAFNSSGCVVAVIVWDDQSSWNTPYIGDILEKGMMMTHDEATYKVTWSDSCGVIHFVVTMILSKEFDFKRLCLPH